MNILRFLTTCYLVQPIGSKKLGREEVGMVSIGSKLVEFLKEILYAFIQF